MEIISKTEAQNQGLSKYFTGKPCKNSHVSQRYVNGGGCCECLCLQSKREDYKATKKEYYKKNADRLVAASRKQYWENLDKALSNKKEYRQRKKAAIAALNAKRRAAKKDATPGWLTSEDRRNMKAIYEMSERVSRCLGIRQHVDHIIPLSGETVSGLHVPWNLSILPARLNISKRNKVLQP